MHFTHWHLRMPSMDETNTRCFSQKMSKQESSIAHTWCGRPWSKRSWAAPASPPRSWWLLILRPSWVPATPGLESRCRSGWSGATLEGRACRWPGHWSGQSPIPTHSRRWWCRVLGEKQRWSLTQASFFRGGDAFLLHFYLLCRNQGLLLRFCVFSFSS